MGGRGESSVESPTALRSLPGRSSDDCNLSPPFHGRLKYGIERLSRRKDRRALQAGQGWRSERHAVMRSRRLSQKVAVVRKFRLMEALPTMMQSIREDQHLRQTGFSPDFGLGCFSIPLYQRLSCTQSPYPNSTGFQF